MTTVSRAPTTGYQPMSARKETGWVYDCRACYYDSYYAGIPYILFDVFRMNVLCRAIHRTRLCLSVLSAYVELYIVLVYVCLSYLQVAEMLEINADDREDSPMRLALVQGGANMQRMFARKVGHLKASHVLLQQVPAATTAASSIYLPKRFLYYSIDRRLEHARPHKVHDKLDSASIVASLYSFMDTPSTTQELGQVKRVGSQNLRYLPTLTSCVPLEARDTSSPNRFGMCANSCFVSGRKTWRRGKKRPPSRRRSSLSFRASS